FFQAEDGIRDYKVTGVQTCALPIYIDWKIHYSGPRKLSSERPTNSKPLSLCTEQSTPLQGFLRSLPRCLGTYGGFCRTRSQFTRSEERRVGKECRYRWARDTYKEQK